MLAAAVVVLMAAAFGCAWLVLGGPLGGYQFERGPAPSGHDVLIARVQVITGAVLAVGALASTVTSAVFRTTGLVWTVLVGQIFLALPVWCFLHIFVWGIAF